MASMASRRPRKEEGAKDPKTLKALEELDRRVSAATIGALTHNSASTIANLAVDGVIPKGRNGYPLVATLQAWAAYQKTMSRAKKAPVETPAQAAKAREIELRIAERTRELIPLVEAEAAIDDLVGMVRTELSGIPAAVTGDRDLRDKIRTGLDGALERVAQRLAKHAQALRSGGAALEAEPEDEPGPMGGG